MTLAQVSRMVDCHVRLDLHPEAEYLASLTRKPTRRYNRRLSTDVQPTQPNPHRIQANRRNSVGPGTHTTATSTVTAPIAPINREAALLHLNMPNLLQLDAELIDGENCPIIGDEMNVNEDGLTDVPSVLNEEADNITEAMASNIQDMAQNDVLSDPSSQLTDNDRQDIESTVSNIIEDMAVDEVLSHTSSQVTDDGLNSTPSVSNKEDIEFTVDEKSDEIPSTSGFSGFSGGRTVSKWVNVNMLNNENDRNASNLPPFIPFKIRGRRPSANFRTTLEPIFERPESPED